MGNSTSNTRKLNPISRTSESGAKAAKSKIDKNIDDELNEISDNLLETNLNDEQEITEQEPSAEESKELLIPVEIKWLNQSNEHIDKISVIGSFTNWNKFIRLSKCEDNSYMTTVNLKLGVHKLLYVVNNEYRISELLPTATDQEGLLFNWFEVINSPYNFTAGINELKQIQKKSNSFLLQESKTHSVEFEHVEYLNSDDSIKRYHEDSFTDPSENQSGVSVNNQSITNQSVYSINSATHNLPPCRNAPIEYTNEIPTMNRPTSLEPPQLPPYLNNVLLNKSAGSANNGISSPNRPELLRTNTYYDVSSFVIPNHVILNHLITTSIKNDILIVGCINRYSGKFVTQIMYSPVKSE